MPWQLRLFMIVPLLVLAGRVFVSRDPQWKRLAAAVFILLAALAEPWLRQEVTVQDARYPVYYHALEILHILAFYGAGLWLLIWAFRTRDPRWQRIVSAFAGLFGLAPLLITLAGSLPAIFASAREGA